MAFSPRDNGDIGEYLAMRIRSGQLNERTTWISLQQSGILPGKTAVQISNQFRHQETGILAMLDNPLHVPLDASSRQIILQYYYDQILPDVRVRVQQMLFGAAILPHRPVNNVQVVPDLDERALRGCEWVRHVLVNWRHDSPLCCSVYIGVVEGGAVKILLDLIDKLVYAMSGIEVTWGSTLVWTALLVMWGVLFPAVYLFAKLFRE